MRLYEIENVVDIQLQYIAESMDSASARRIFENSPNAKIIDNFISLANTVAPLTTTDIGKTFYPVNLIVMPDSEFMSIAKFSHDATLVKINHDSYIFQLGKVTTTFPCNKENSFIYRLIFPTKLDYERYEMSLLLKFGTWRIINKIL